MCRKLADTLRKKTKRKKKTGRSSLSGDSTPHFSAGQSGQDDTESEQPITPKSTLDSDSTDAELAMDQSSQPASESLPRHQLTQRRAASVGGDSGVSLSTVPGTSRGTATAHHSRTSSAIADLDQDSQSDVGVDAARQEEIRADLDAAVTQANSAIEAGIAVGDDVLQMVLDELDAAIQQAVEASISAKYSKKVRKRLQLLLQEAVTTAAGDDNNGAAAAFPTAQYNIPAPNREWQTAGARVHKPGSSKSELPSMGGSSSHAGSQSPQQQRRHLRQTTGQAQAQGHFVHALLPPEAQYGGVARPPPPPPPARQPPSSPLSQPLLRPGSAEMPSGPSRNKTGNAWGVSAMQCFSPQVSCCYPLLLAVPLCCLHSPVALKFTYCRLPVYYYLFQQA